MESNKDEALKCLSIAKKSLELGDYAKALRFTEKSIRLFPTHQGEQLLILVKNKSAEPKKPSSTRPAASTPSSTPSRPSDPAPQDRKYTTEQLRAVKTILACGKDYYKVLSVERTATDIQIKKAYRKVSYLETL
jgi:DnaJ family protein B protein 12